VCRQQRERGKNEPINKTWWKRLISTILPSGLHKADTATPPSTRCRLLVFEGEKLLVWGMDGEAVMDVSQPP
jgi:hypothetical protein